MSEGARQAPAKGNLAFVSIALCFAVAVLEGFDIQAIGVAAPKLAPELGLGRDQMGWVFFASNLALVIGASCGGWMADKLGRKPVFVGAFVRRRVAELAKLVRTHAPKTSPWLGNAFIAQEFQRYRDIVLKHTAAIAAST
jgi:MFS family permease